MGLLLSSMASAEKAKKPPPAVSQGNLKASPSSLSLVYLKHQHGNLKVRPFFDPFIPDEGIKGGELGIIDNNTTGQFTGQTFSLKYVEIRLEDSLSDRFKSLLKEGHQLFVLDLNAEEQITLASLPEAAGVLLFNIASSEDRLRGADCRKNLLHIIPSHAMKADALAQYLGKKRWQKWLLVTQSQPEDALYADAIRKSAKKFGAKIVADKPWSHTFDERRTPESEIPVFTQDTDYDVLVVIDTERSLGDLFPYRTWLPRPVVGTSGLVPSSWHSTHEAFGALQLQNRFMTANGRPMKDKDYAAWLSVRAIGESATRTKSTDLQSIKSFLLGEDFALGGFKGVPLSFRSWDQQLRQPLILGAERGTVALAPIEGYLHPTNELDTLGTDQPESTCRLQ
jgi:ABC transporter substrate binding protein (PQQ-dependent alcohol dehydrogenase system)